VGIKPVFLLALLAGCTVGPNFEQPSPWSPLSWFRETGGLVRNHLAPDQSIPTALRQALPDLDQRSQRVVLAEPIMFECVVRGYISGSGWKDYQATGAVCGIGLPAGLRESDRLPEPIFTPTTKATTGHDEAVDFEGAVRLTGDRAVAERLREVSIAVYEHAAEHARQRGIILADTKFEFGFDADGTLTLGDEVCTPDSSRFWPADEYEPGHGQPSFDKQFVRDWASSTGWNRTPPAPAIPDDVVARTREKYLDASARLLGNHFAIAGSSYSSTGWALEQARPHE